MRHHPGLQISTSNQIFPHFLLQFSVIILLTLLLYIHSFLSCYSYSYSDILTFYSLFVLIFFASTFSPLVHKRIPLSQRTFPLSPFAPRQPHVPSMFKTFLLIIFLVRNLNIPSPLLGLRLPVCVCILSCLSVASCLLVCHFLACLYEYPKFV